MDTGHGGQDTQVAAGIALLDGAQAIVKQNGMKAAKAEGEHRRVIVKDMAMEVVMRKAKPGLAALDLEHLRKIPILKMMQQQIGKIEVSVGEFFGVKAIHAQHARPGYPVGRKKLHGVSQVSQASLSPTGQMP